MKERLISADGLIELCNIMADKCDGIGTNIWHQFATTVEWTPTIDAEPVRHGHWIKERNPMMYQTIPYVWVCDQCGTAFYYKTPYCGECGARMDEEDV